MRRTILLLLALAASTGNAAGQSSAPDPHWGANVFPRPSSELRIGGYFNRFTQFSKSGTQFNEIDETAGFNILSVSYSDRIPALPDYSFAVNAGVGWSSDEPTRWFQNDVVHEILGQAEVPVGATRDEAEFVGGFGITRWYESRDLGDRAFWGAGFVTGTLYHEPYVHVGVSHLFDDWNVRVGLLNRTSAPLGGNAYEDVASFNNLTQLYLGYVPGGIGSSNWLQNFLGNPEYGVTLTYDTGLFEDANNDAIDVWFASLSARWATGLQFETWNDFANGTDFGPTYGFLISVDVLTLSNLIK